LLKKVWQLPKLFDMILQVKGQARRVSCPSAKISGGYPSVRPGRTTFEFKYFREFETECSWIYEKKRPKMSCFSPF
jgi:hypothetical protein